MPQLYLASASARRAELLRQIGVPFAVCIADIDEQVLPEETPPAYVERLAKGKAQATLARLTDVHACVLGADTSVVLAGRILGKPHNLAATREILTSLSGQTHQVLTAIALANQQRCVSAVVSSWVSFRPLSAAEIDAYWATGEPQDKAGSYAIQGLGAVFIRHLAGSYSAVMGLPLFETAQLLADFGIGHWKPIC